MKFFLSVLIIVLSFTPLSSQQNEDFRAITSYFNNQRKQLFFEYEREKKIANYLQGIALENKFQEFMTKIDSVENVALIGALIRTKNNEDLEKINHSFSNENYSEIRTDDLVEKKPKYPGGIDVLREQVSSLFYFNTEIAELKQIKTNVSFVVEPTGFVSQVQASGDFPVFNRQAEIAIYLLPEKFEPAKINGKTVRYKFSLPLTLNFE